MKWGSVRGRALSAVLCCVVLIAAGLASQSDVANARGRTASLRFVNSTGHTLSGPFLQYLQIMGYDLLGDPLSEPMTLDGATVQWFERGRLDLTPSGGVVLGPVGTLLAPQGASVNATDGTQSMAKISTASLAIQQFYEEHGGAALFGQPIGPIADDSQWFERARLDFNAMDGAVEMGEIGADAMSKVGLDPHGARIEWVATTSTVGLREVPLLRAPSIPLAAAHTVIKTGSIAGWAQVWDPVLNRRGWVLGDAIGPSEPPVWVDLVQEITPAPSRARVMSYDSEWSFNAQVHLMARATTVDGVETYLDTDGDLVNSDALRFPRQPVQYYPGKWIDADLQEPVMLTAYEGEKIVYVALAVKGRPSNPTPLGKHQVLRRVENERMNSASWGAPGLYDVSGVLFTQYFTGDGAALHYNWWRSNWGGTGSFGCLGMNYDDSKWFWDWASIGTPVIVHN